MVITVITTKATHIWWSQSIHLYLLRFKSSPTLPRRGWLLLLGGRPIAGLLIARRVPLEPANSLVPCFSLAPAFERQECIQKSWLNLLLYVDFNTLKFCLPSSVFKFNFQPRSPRVGGFVISLYKFSLSEFPEMRVATSSLSCRLVVENYFEGRRAQK